MAVYVRNCYQRPSRLFIVGRSEITSCEGTTQGDPLAMPMYAIAVTSLRSRIKQPEEETTRHAAFADDFAGAGTIFSIREWWNPIVENGPKFGYYPNASKSWLLVKRSRRTSAFSIRGYKHQHYPSWTKIPGRLHWKESRSTGVCGKKRRFVVRSTTKTCKSSAK